MTLRRHSLRMRLLALSVVTIAAALLLAWLAITIVFERHIRMRLAEELIGNTHALIANLQWQDGQLVLGVQPPDPRFERPLGGLYWQIDHDNAVDRFGDELGLAVLLIGLALSAAATLQVSIGLTPLGALRAQISAIRTGRQRRLDPQVPKEVGPLVDEVNELLLAQEDALTRARTQAGDLAHG